MFSKDNKVSMKRRVFAAAAAMLVTSALVVPAAAYAADNDQYTPADVPDELTTAVDEAKNVGITVTQSEDVKQPNQSASDKDYAAQVKALKELIEKAKANTEACTQAQGLAKRINDRVDELKAQYPNAKVTTRSITASDLAEYERQANNAGAENEAALNKYTTEKAEVDRHNADTKRVEDSLKNHSCIRMKLPEFMLPASGTRQVMALVTTASSLHTWLMLQRKVLYCSRKQDGCRALLQSRMPIPRLSSIRRRQASLTV